MEIVEKIGWFQKYTTILLKMQSQKNLCKQMSN